jgi:hypothetical protein
VIEREELLETLRINFQVEPCNGRIRITATICAKGLIGSGKLNEKRLRELRHRLSIEGDCSIHVILINLKR